MTVAGIRVFMLGVNILSFALLRDRRGTGIATLIAVVVPLADGIVALRHAAKPWTTAFAFHWLGAGLAGWLAYKLLVVW